MILHGENSQYSLTMTEFSNEKVNFPRKVVHDKLYFLLHMLKRFLRESSIVKVGRKVCVHIIKRLIVAEGSEI